MSQDTKALATADGLSGKISKSQGLFAKPPAGAAETSYELVTSFIGLPNKLTFVKAATSGTARIFQVGAPMSYKVVKWSASRVGCPPQSPAVETDTKWTLLYTQLDGMSPGVGADGFSKFYTVTGSYVYVRSEAFTTSDDYAMGVPPIYTYSTESATITAGVDFHDVYSNEKRNAPPETGPGSSGSTPPSSANSSSSPSTTDTNPGMLSRLPPYP